MHVSILQGWCISSSINQHSGEHTSCEVKINVYDIVSILFCLYSKALLQVSENSSHEDSWLSQRNIQAAYRTTLNYSTMSSNKAAEYISQAITS